MKKMRLGIFSLTVLTLVFAGSCKKAPDSDRVTTTNAKQVAKGDFTEISVDTAASTLEWIGTKVTSYHAGTVEIKNGELYVKDGQLKGGKFILDMPTLAATNKDPGTNGRLTNHLKSADFFEVNTYPEAVFEITDVQPYSGNNSVADADEKPEISQYKVTDPNVTISGNLTIKNVTKNISFPAHADVNGNTVHAVAKFSINRKDWGIVYPGAPDDLIKDEIWFGISLTTKS